MSDERSGEGPPPPSPLTGAYLLIVLPQLHSAQHKDRLIHALTKGLITWDAEDCHVDLDKELNNITSQAPEGEEAKNGERLIQFASENLVTEVLIHPQLNTLVQCMRNCLSSFTRHRHIVHAGYTSSGNGAWVLQDGTYSFSDFADMYSEHEVQRVLRAYEGTVSVDVHCSGEGDWWALKAKDPFSKVSRVRLNPPDKKSTTPAVRDFLNYLGQYLVPASLTDILESSDVVGNIRFSHPTLYVFPGGQGDAALFGINGFNMLVDGGFSRKSCFWDFTRHLDRLDSVLMTRINNGNLQGLASLLRRKKSEQVYPQIGHFFSNIPDRRQVLSPDGDKDRDPLLINLIEEGQEMLSGLRQLGLKPQACYRDPSVEPINLYHKVGHGKLDMYVLSPAKDSREVREFLAKWAAVDSKIFCSYSRKGEFNFPLCSKTSICALLVWQPANPEDNITRLLFPGSTPQQKIFEGLDKLKNLEFMKHPVCSAKSLSPSSSTMKLSIKAAPPKAPLIEKVAENEKKQAETVKAVKQVGEVKKAALPPKAKPKVDRPKEKTEKTKTDLETKQETVKKSSEAVQKLEKETKEVKKEKPKKIVQKQAEKKTQKPPEKKADSVKSSPTTPKKTVENKLSEMSRPENKIETKTRASRAKASPPATPAKSAKEENNRKVVELKSKETSRLQAQKAHPPKKDEPKKIERPVSKKPSTSPKGGKSLSPVKAARPGAKQKLDVKKTGKSEKEITTDSSAVSTPSTVDAELTKAKEDAEKTKEVDESKQEELDRSRKESEDRGKSTSKEEDEEILIIEKVEISNEVTGKSDVETIAVHLQKAEEEKKKIKTELKGEDLVVSEKEKDEKEELPLEAKQAAQEEVQEIIETATEIVTKKLDMQKTESQDISGKDLGSTPKEKEVKSVDVEQKIDESQPDEKFSTTVESGATTTAPTLPEDERIPLDEIKEGVEEKYVKEETKEKEVIVTPRPGQPTSLPQVPVIAGTIFDQRAQRLKDIVKTPDEVADLPVHEEADIGIYEGERTEELLSLSAAKRDRKEEATEELKLFKDNLEKEDKSKDLKEDMVESADVLSHTTTDIDLISSSPKSGKPQESEEKEEHMPEAEAKPGTGLDKEQEKADKSEIEVSDEKKREKEEKIDEEEKGEKPDTVDKPDKEVLKPDIEEKPAMSIKEIKLDEEEKYQVKPDMEVQPEEKGKETKLDEKEAKVDEKESKLDERELKFDEKEAKIGEKEVQHEVKDKETKVEEKEAKLDERELKFDEKEAKIGEKEVQHEVKDKETKVEEKEAKIGEKEVQPEEKDKETKLDEKEATFDEKEEKMDEIEAKLDEKEAMFDEKESKLGEKELKFDEKEAEIDEKEVQPEEKDKETKVDEKEIKIGEKEVQPKEKDKETKLDEKEATFDEQEAKLYEKEAMVDEKESRLGEKELKFDEKEAEIDEKELQPEEKDKETKFDEKEVKIDEKEAKIDEKEAKLDEKEATIIEKEAKFDEKEVTIVEQEAKFDEKEATRDEKEAKLDEKDVMFDEKESKLGEKELKFDEKEAEIDEKEVQPEEKDKETKLDEKEDKIPEKEAKFDEKEAKFDEKEEKFDEKEAKIDEKEAKIDEKEAKVDEKEAMFDEKAAKVDEKEAKFDEKEAKIDEKEPKIDEKEAKVDKKEAMIDEKAAKVDEKEAKFDEKEVTIVEKEATSDEKEATRDEKEAKLDEKEVTIVEKEATSDEKEATRDEKEAKLDEKEAMFDEKESKLGEKELKFDEKEAEVDEKEVQPEEKAKETKLDEKEAKIDEKEAKIDEKEAKIDAKEATILDKEAKFDEMEATIVEKEAKFDEKEAKIDEKEAKFDEKDATVVEKEAKFDAKDVTIGEKEAEFDEKEVTFDEKEAMIDEKEAKFDEKEAKFDEKEAKFDEKEAKLDKKEAKLDEKEVKLDKKAVKLDEKEVKLDEKEAKRDEKEAKFDEKEAKFDEKEAKLDKKEAKLDEKEVKLDKKEFKLDEKQVKLDEKEALLAEREARLAEKEAKLDEEAKEAKADIEEKEAKAVESKKEAKADKVEKDIKADEEKKVEKPDEEEKEGKLDKEIKPLEEKAKIEEEEKQEIQKVDKPSQEKEISPADQTVPSTKADGLQEVISAEKEEYITTELSSEEKEIDLKGEKLEKTAEILEQPLVSDVKATTQDSRKGIEKEKEKSKTRDEISEIITEKKVIEDKMQTTALEKPKEAEVQKLEVGEVESKDTEVKGKTSPTFEEDILKQESVEKISTLIQPKKTPSPTEKYEDKASEPEPQGTRKASPAKEIIETEGLEVTEKVEIESKIEKIKEVPQAEKEESTIKSGKEASEKPLAKEDIKQVATLSEDKIYTDETDTSFVDKLDLDESKLKEHTYINGLLSEDIEERDLVKDISDDHVKTSEDVVKSMTKEEKEAAGEKQDEEKLISSALIDARDQQKEEGEEEDIETSIEEKDQKEKTEKLKDLETIKEDIGKTVDLKADVISVDLSGEVKELKAETIKTELQETVEEITLDQKTIEEQTAKEVKEDEKTVAIVEKIETKTESSELVREPSKPALTEEPVELETKEISTIKSMEFPTEESLKSKQSVEKEDVEKRKKESEVVVNGFLKDVADEKPEFSKEVMPAPSTPPKEKEVTKIPMDLGVIQIPDSVKELKSTSQDVGVLESELDESKTPEQVAEQKLIKEDEEALSEKKKMEIEKDQKAESSAKLDSKTTVAEICGEPSSSKTDMKMDKIESKGQEVQEADIVKDEKTKVPTTEDKIAVDEKLKDKKDSDKLGTVSRLEDEKEQKEVSLEETVVTHTTKEVEEKLKKELETKEKEEDSIVMKDEEKTAEDLGTKRPEDYEKLKIDISGEVQTSASMIKSDIHLKQEEEIVEKTVMKDDEVSHAETKVCETLDVKQKDGKEVVASESKIDLDQKQLTDEKISEKEEKISIKTEEKMITSEGKVLTELTTEVIKKDKDLPEQLKGEREEVELSKKEREDAVKESVLVESGVSITKKEQKAETVKHLEDEDQKTAEDHILAEKSKIITDSKDEELVITEKETKTIEKKEDRIEVDTLVEQETAVLGSKEIISEKTVSEQIEEDGEIKSSEKKVGALQEIKEADLIFDDKLLTKTKGEEDITGKMMDDKKESEKELFVDSKDLKEQTLTTGDSKPQKVTESEILQEKRVEELGVLQQSKDIESKALEKSEIPEIKSFVSKASEQTEEVEPLVAKEKDILEEKKFDETKLADETKYSELKISLEDDSKSKIEKASKPETSDKVITQGEKLDGAFKDQEELKDSKSMALEHVISETETGLKAIGGEIITEVKVLSSTDLGKEVDLLSKEIDKKESKTTSGEEDIGPQPSTDIQKDIQSKLIEDQKDTQVKTSEDKKYSETKPSEEKTDVKSIILEETKDTESTQGDKVIESVTEKDISQPIKCEQKFEIDLQEPKKDLEAKFLVDDKKDVDSKTSELIKDEEAKCLEDEKSKLLDDGSKLVEEKTDLDHKPLKSQVVLEPTAISDKKEIDSELSIDKKADVPAQPKPLDQTEQDGKIVGIKDEGKISTEKKDVELIKSEEKKGIEALKIDTDTIRKEVDEIVKEEERTLKGQKDEEIGKEIESIPSKDFIEQIQKQDLSDKPLPTDKDGSVSIVGLLSGKKDEKEGESDLELAPGKDTTIMKERSEIEKEMVSVTKPEDEISKDLDTKKTDIPQDKTDVPLEKEVIATHISEIKSVISEKECPLPVSKSPEPSTHTQESTLLAATSKSELKTSTEEKKQTDSTEIGKISEVVSSETLTAETSFTIEPKKTTEIDVSKAEKGSIDSSIKEQKTEKGHLTEFEDKAAFDLSLTTQLKQEVKSLDLHTETKELTTEETSQKAEPKTSKVNGHTEKEIEDTVCSKEKIETRTSASEEISKTESSETRETTQVISSISAKGEKDTANADLKSKLKDEKQPQLTDDVHTHEEKETTLESSKVSEIPCSEKRSSIVTDEAKELSLKFTNGSRDEKHLEKISSELMPEDSLTTSTILSEHSLLSNGKSGKDIQASDEGCSILKTELKEEKGMESSVLTTITTTVTTQEIVSEPKPSSSEKTNGFQKKEDLQEKTDSSKPESKCTQESSGKDGLGKVEGEQICKVEKIITEKHEIESVKDVSVIKSKLISDVSPALNGSASEGETSSLKREKLTNGTQISGHDKEDAVTESKIVETSIKTIKTEGTKTSSEGGKQTETKQQGELETKETCATKEISSKESLESSSSPKTLESKHETLPQVSALRDISMIKDMTASFISTEKWTGRAVDTPEGRLSPSSEASAVWRESDDDLPASPLSTTSHVHSPPPAMFSSVYGQRFEDDDSDVDFETAVREHTEVRGLPLTPKDSSLGQSFLAQSKESDPLLHKDSPKAFLDSGKPSTTSLDKTLAGTESHQSTSTSSQSFISSKDPIGKWDKPLGLPPPPSGKNYWSPFKEWGRPLHLPSPAPPPNENDNEDTSGSAKTTPKKVAKMNEENNRYASNIVIGKEANNKNRRSDSPVKKGMRDGKKTGMSHIYLDLSYVPHHGNSHYANVEFFKRVRARYYVFSGTEPSKEVFNALLEAKQTWEDKDLEVTIIPTYDTDTLGYWIAENEETLSKYKIDLSPSASRCTINLQDHDTSCSAYRLEF